LLRTLYTLSRLYNRLYTHPLTRREYALPCRSDAALQIHELEKGSWQLFWFHCFMGARFLGNIFFCLYDLYYAAAPDFFPILVDHNLPFVMLKNKTVIPDGIGWVDEGH